MVILTVADSGPFGHIVDVGAEYLNAPSGVLTDALGRPIGSGLRRRMKKIAAQKIEDETDDVDDEINDYFPDDDEKLGPANWKSRWKRTNNQTHETESYEDFKDMMWERGRYARKKAADEL